MTWNFDLPLALVLVGALGCSPEGGTGGEAGRGGQGGGRAGTTGSGGSGRGGAVNGAGMAGGGARGGAPNSGGASPGGASPGGTGGGGTGGASTGGGAGFAAMGGVGGFTSSGGAGAGGGTGGGSGGSGGLSGGASGGAGVGGMSGASGGAGDTVDAVAMAKAMGFGTNIGNTLENTSVWETGWGQPLISQEYINGLASHGIKNVRVPVAWDTYAANGTIDATKTERVKQVVGWIEAAGMYSIVNIHWDGGWIDNGNEGNPNEYKLTDDVKTKFASYWTQISGAFSAVGHKLIFEGLNEESKFYLNGDTNQPDYAALNTLNQLFVTTVRGQSGYNKTRALLIAGFTTDIERTCVDAFTIPSDPAGAGKLLLSVHYYTPYTFCGLDTVESWGSPQTTWGTDAEKKTLEDLFTKLADFSAQRKVPVILGEFGVTRGESYPREPASRTLWMASVIKASFAHGIVPVLWDTGSEISRTDGSFSTELQSAMSDVDP